MLQIIYKAEEEGDVEIARIQDGQFSGPQANQIKEFLVKLGWPRKSADRILWGDYLWCSEPIEEGEKSEETNR